MDHYEILGVRPGASEAEINKAFWKEAKSAHPDHGGDEKRFNQISQARKAALSHSKTSVVYGNVKVTPTHPAHYEPETIRGPVTVFYPGLSRKHFPVFPAIDSAVLSFFSLN